MERAATIGSAVCAAALLLSLFGFIGGGRRRAVLAARLAAGGAAFGEQRFEEAAARFAEATRADPRSVEAWNFLGNAHLALSRRAEALAAYERALALDSDFTSALLGRAMTRWLAGDLEASEADYRRLLTLHPDSTLYYTQLEKVLAEQEKFDAIAQLWTQAAAAHPGDPDWNAVGRIAGALFRAKNWDRLETVSREAIGSAKTARDAAVYRYYAGVAANHLNQPAAGLAQLETVFGVEPRNLPIDYLRLFEELVYAASASGDADKAERYRAAFESYCAQFPANGCRP